MTVRVHRTGDPARGPVEAVELVGLTPDFAVRFVADDPPVLYVDAGGTDGLVVGTDLPALIDALSQLAGVYGFDLTAPPPDTGDGEPTHP